MAVDSDTLQYKKMTEAPVAGLIIRLGIPTIISMLITNIYNMANTYFVSRLGTSASGAVGVVFGLMAVLQAFGFMFGQGAGSIVSRKLGAKDVKSASRYASTGFWLAFFFGLVIEIFGLIFLDPFMKLLGSTDTILPYARDYGFYILISAPFMTSSCVLNNVLRYEGRASLAMIGLTAGGLLNMAGDPILMFACHMDVRGAGLSTALSQIISFFILLAMFLSGRTQSRLSIRFCTRSFHEMMEIVTVGFPSMMRQGLSSVSTMLLNRAAGAYGDAAIAAMSIVGRVSFFIFAVGLGIGQGFQPVSGYSYGAKKYSRVKKGVLFTIAAGEVLLLAFSVLGFIFARQIITLFRDYPEVISAGVFPLRCQCAACIFQPVTVGANMLFQSTGNSGRATLLAALRSGIFFIPLILILPHFLGLTGIQISQTCADVLSCLTSVPLLAVFLKDLPPDGEALKPRRAAAE